MEYNNSSNYESNHLQYCLGTDSWKSCWQSDSELATPNFEHHQLSSKKAFSFGSWWDQYSKESQTRIYSDFSHDLADQIHLPHRTTELSTEESKKQQGPSPQCNLLDDRTTPERSDSSLEPETAQLQENRHICPHCSTSFSRLSDLHRHQRKHSKSFLWYCGCCDPMKERGFYRRDKLRQHMRQIHRMESLNECFNSSCCPEGRFAFCTNTCLLKHQLHDHEDQPINSLINQNETSQLNMGSTKVIPKKVSRKSKLVSQHSNHHTTELPGPSCRWRSVAAKRPLRSPSLPPKKRGDSQGVDSSLQEIGGELERSEIDQVMAPIQTVSSAPLAQFDESTILSGVGSWQDLGSWNENFTRTVDWDGLPEPIAETAWSQVQNSYPSTALSDLNHWFDTSLFVPPQDQSNLKEEEVPGIYVADMLVLFRFNDFCILNALPVSFVARLQATGLNAISYNSLTGDIILRGTSRATKSAKDLLLNTLDEAWSEYKFFNWLREKTGLWSSLTGPIPHSQKISASPLCACEKSYKIFAIRVSEDSSFIDTWTRYLLPCLPNILKVSLGETYTASLVRQGPSETLSVPRICIQSPRGQTVDIRKHIQLKVDEICDVNGRSRIQVQFSKGSVKLLANSHKGGEEQDGKAELDDEEEDEVDFPYWKWYSQNPGMGASIGPSCSRHITATLGGYVLVDGKTYVLTAGHFVEDFLPLQSNATSRHSRPTVTSPSLLDVDEMIDSFAMTLRSVKIKIKNLFDQEFGSNGYELWNSPSAWNSLPNTCSENLCWHIYRFALLKRLQRKLQQESDFIIGSIFHYRFPKLGDPQAAIINSHRMDWALCSVNSRAGENRHVNPFSIDELSEEQESPTTGELCTETCSLKHNMRVHYVGQKSGYQTGLVDGVPKIITINGIQTNEWTIVPLDGEPRRESCKGDSGAWVIDDATNRLAGMVYGVFNGQVLCTPIEEIFAHIKTTIPGTTVCLPHQRNSPDFAAIPIPTNVEPLPQLTSEHKITARKAQAYKWRRKSIPQSGLKPFNRDIWKEIAESDDSYSARLTSVSPPRNLTSLIKINPIPSLACGSAVEDRLKAKLSCYIVSQPKTIRSISLVIHKPMCKPWLTTNCIRGKRDSFDQRKIKETIENVFKKRNGVIRECQTVLGKRSLPEAQSTRKRMRFSHVAAKLSNAKLYVTAQA